MTSHVFLDTETTGLSPLRGAQMWELAMVFDDHSIEWQLPVSLAAADTLSLRLNGFYDRRPGSPSRDHDLGDVCAYRVDRTDALRDAGWVHGLTAAHAAGRVAQQLNGAHIVGANPAFDAQFLELWLNEHGHAATWDHHLVDVEERVAALYGLPAGIGLRKSAELIGLEVDTDRTHSALYDAQLTKRIYAWCIERAPFSVPDEEATA